MPVCARRQRHAGRPTVQGAIETAIDRAFGLDQAKTVAGRRNKLTVHVEDKGGAVKVFLRGEIGELPNDLNLRLSQRVASILAPLALKYHLDLSRPRRSASKGVSVLVSEGLCASAHVRFCR